MGTLRKSRLVKHAVLVTAVLALSFTEVAGSIISSTSRGEAGRVLTEAGANSEDDTVRVDPLDNLKKYRGGYNITNEHYWSSTAFTGIYGYLIAVICLLLGLGYGVILLVTSSCKSRRELEKRSFFRNCHLKLLLLAIFFTLLAITACGLVFGGNSKFHSRAKTVVGIIINAADESSSTIYNTTGAMKNMSITLREADGSFQATDFLNSTTQRLDSQAAEIETKASKNRHIIYKGLNIAYVVTTVMISLTLLVVVSLLASRVLKFQRSLQVLIAFCWIFVILCWLFFGIYFFLWNFAGDTCRALAGFHQDPYNNSLSTILPCEELLSAKSILIDVSAGIHYLVNKVNENISTSYGNIAQICNPFSSPPMYEYQPWNCPPNSVRIGDVPKLLRMLACPDSVGTCNGGMLVPSSYYKTVDAYSISIQTLLDAYPGMLSLVECQMVKNALSEILYKHCKPLKRYLRLLWTALLFLSVVLVALVLIWAFGSHHEQSHRPTGGLTDPR